MSILRHSNTVTVMRSLNRTTTAMIRMTTTGHNQVAIRTAMAMDLDIIIIMGIQHSVTMPNSTTTTITTCGDNEKKDFRFFLLLLILPRFSQKKNTPFYASRLRSPDELVPCFFLLLPSIVSSPLYMSTVIF